MPMLRSSTATQALNFTKSRTTAMAPSPSVTAPCSRRMLSNTPRRAAASGVEVSDSDLHDNEQHHHEERFDPPTGWLFGVKPGEKYEKEGWENIWMYGMFGSLGVAAIAYAFKPDTSIQTWALEEARRRLEAEGILKEPDDKP